jgi:tetratricopeptide (TPR) repeat protein
MKRWLTVFGAFALVVASGMEAHAQMGTARGEVVDESGAPVAGATVELVFLGELERKYTLETDDDGMYIRVVPTGMYRVVASKEGYQGSYMDRSVRTGDTTDLPTLEIVSQRIAARKAMAPILEQFEKAAELSAAGKLDEAIALYREVEREHPEIPELHFNLGTVYARQEKWAEAEAAYQRALELEPDNAQAQVLLADVHRNMGLTDEAVAAMEKLIAENPDNAQLHYDLGIFYLNAKRDEDAFAAFEEVRRRDPDNVDALYLLGTLSINLDRIEQAVDLLESYLEKAPEDGRYRALASDLLSNLQPAETSSQ